MFSLPRFRLLTLLCSLLTGLAAASVPMTPRNLLAGPPELHALGKDIPDIQAALLPHGEWTPYPRAADRAGWESLDEAVRADLIAQGEAAAAAGPWEIMSATAFLDYMRTGSRKLYHEQYNERRHRFLQLVLAECAEGEGRFLDPIADGLWAHLEESFWGYPAHIFMQRAGDDLPDVTEPIVDLGVSETAAMLAWVDHLLGPELAGVSPVLRHRLQHEVQRRFLEPCLNRADFWWMAWDTQGHPINNWNPWIVSNWIAAALLIETDPLTRARHIEKAQRVLDIFLNSYPADGGCDEGPAYWGRAGASMFEALDWMHGASAGRIDIYDEPLIQAMGRYILNAHVGDGWYINFADATALTTVEGVLAYRYGRAVGDDELAGFGAWLWQRDHGKSFNSFRRSLGRILPELFLAAELADQPAAAPLPANTWLPDLQVMTARDTADTTRGLYLAAKGGHNDESHNHNDVGSFLAYLDGLPLIIDAGPEAYTAKTFSPQRYEIWTMRSGWHNLPLVNGQEQQAGRQFAAQDVVYIDTTDHASLALDLGAAYPANAHITSWRRELTLQRPERLHITDTYELSETTGPTAYHFLVNRPVELGPEGTVQLGAFPGHPDSRGATLNYDAEVLTAYVTTLEITDARLQRIWGPEVHRIELVEKNTPLAATRTFEIRPTD
jgi:hypothetical protein